MKIVNILETVRYELENIYNLIRCTKFLVKKKYIKIL